jgi:ketosteroid isomerase-like protein
MDHGSVQAWLDRYVQAWRANQPEPIGALFSEDATYRFRPYGSDADTVRGRAAIVDAWLDEPDDPGSWDAEYEPYAVEGDRAVAVGRSHYAAVGDTPERTYHNVFLLRFAPDGRCAEFTELFMLEKRT